MRVIDTFLIKGRGWCVSVTDAPPTQIWDGTEKCGLRHGMHVHQANNTWVIIAIEAYAIPVAQITLGLVLRPIEDAPPTPEPGELTYSD